MKGITLLAGCEVDILADGRLDFEDAMLAELDIVVASPHISLKQDSAKATDRILRAIDNRYVNVIGHPTGRLIFGRDGLPLNFPRIFKAAADTGTALEINAAFPRLDLNDVNAHGAIAAGVKLSINTDAHNAQDFDQMKFGIFVAQRAWATPADIINCMTLAKLKEFIRRKRAVITFKPSSRPADFGRQVIHAISSRSKLKKENGPKGSHRPRSASNSELLNKR